MKFLRLVSSTPEAATAEDGAQESWKFFKPDYKGKKEYQGLAAKSSIIWLFLFSKKNHYDLSGWWQIRSHWRELWEANFFNEKSDLLPRIFHQNRGSCIKSKDWTCLRTSWCEKNEKNVLAIRLVTHQQWNRQLSGPRSLHFCLSFRHSRRCRTLSRRPWSRWPSADVILAQEQVSRRICCRQRENKSLGSAWRPGQTQWRR